LSREPFGLYLGDDNLLNGLDVHSDMVCDLLQTPTCIEHENEIVGANHSFTGRKLQISGPAERANIGRETRLRMLRMFRRTLPVPFHSWPRIPSRALSEWHIRLGWFRSAMDFSRLASLVDDDVSERMIRNLDLAVDQFMPLAVWNSAKAFASLGTTFVLGGGRLRPWF
jgi:hypothetical protein